MALMLGCTADDVRRARELYTEEQGKGDCAPRAPGDEIYQQCVLTRDGKIVRLPTENYIMGTATVTKPPIPPEQEKEIRTDMQRDR